MSPVISRQPDPWGDALAGAALLALDQKGLGGAILRTPPGPARDAWLTAFRSMLPEDAPVRRVPANIDDDRLLGGLDLAATLAAARPVASRGLLSEVDGGTVVLAMAERCGAATGSRIAAALDSGEVAVERDGFTDRHAANFVVIALEEGVEPDERAPDVLAERLALTFDFTNLRPSQVEIPTRAQIASARTVLARMPAPDDTLIESICNAASAFGVGSPRAALFVLKAARGAAALAGRQKVGEDDLALAARLVLASRALIAPVENVEEPPPPQDESGEDQEAESRQEANAATDRVVDAVRSALPADFLSQFLETRAERRSEARSRGAGAAAKSARRGRPLGARPGTLRMGERLDLVATLRAAAPWQPMRRRALVKTTRALILVRRSDFRVRRFLQRLESTTIFVVDASGSAALQRLAEAKGAVENLLAEAYVTRARVAVIAFKDRSADLLLPPTRSLSRAKRSLADLAGGGTTPLAAAIDAASLLAQSERAKGRTPLIVFLTDGRGNVGRDGEPGRPQAEQDALVAARALRATDLPAVFLDTSPRSRPGAAELAAEMRAAYAPLPFVDAGLVASVVRAHAPGRR